MNGQKKYILVDRVIYEQMQQEHQSLKQQSKPKSPMGNTITKKQVFFHKESIQTSVDQDQEQEMISRVNDIVQKLREEGQEKDDTIAKLEKSIAISEEDIKERDFRIQKIEFYWVQHSKQLHNKLENVKRDNKQLEKTKNLEIQNIQKNNRKLQQEIEELSFQKNRLSFTANQLEKSNSYLQQKLQLRNSEINNIKNSNQELTTKLQKLEDDRRLLEDRKSRPRFHTNLTGSRKKDLEKQFQRIEILEVENQKHIMNLQAAAAVSQNLKKQNEVLQENNKMLRNQLIEAITNENDIRRELKTIKEEGKSQSRARGRSSFSVNKLNSFLKPVVHSEFYSHFKQRPSQASNISHQSDSSGDIPDLPQNQISPCK